MSRNITYSAEEYANQKETHPFRTKVERYTLLTLVGDVNGLRILDAGCGDGVYARTFVDNGAKHVLGIDGAEDFITLAQKKNKEYEGKIAYRHAMIQDCFGNSDCDLVVGLYILSYPRSLEEATAYCSAMTSHLKMGGRFVGFNNNPFEVFTGKKYKKYGMEKEMCGGKEGEQVVYRVDGMDNEIVNFYLDPETYEEAFERAGFSEFSWQRVLLDPAEKENVYWNEFFADEPPFIAMLARK